MDRNPANTHFDRGRGRPKRTGAPGVAARLRSARVDASLGRDVVALLLGTSAKSVERYEVGDRRPSGAYGHAFAYLLAVQWDWLSCGIGKQEWIGLPPVMMKESSWSRTAVWEGQLLAFLRRPHSYLLVARHSRAQATHTRAPWYFDDGEAQANRVAEVHAHSGLALDKFAAQLDLSELEVSRLEDSDHMRSRHVPRFIALAIEARFGVRHQWLRDGHGPRDVNYGHVTLCEPFERELLESLMMDPKLLRRAVEAMVVNEQIQTGTTPSHEGPGGNCVSAAGHSDAHDAFFAGNHGKMSARLLAQWVRGNMKQPKTPTS